MKINTNSSSAARCRETRHQSRESPMRNIDDASINVGSPLVAEIQRQRLRRAVWRDFLFLVAGGIALHIVGYVETHAADKSIRNVSSFTLNDTTSAAIGSKKVDAMECSSESDSSKKSTPSGSTRILDAGFILTSPLHSYLSEHRDVNDVLALFNSVMLAIPLAYVIFVTAWKGDFTLSFRLIATHLFRSFCGWFTYLPPDPEFLMSNYDFPEVFMCLFKNCPHDYSQVPSIPFVTFFSGHVATVVIIANHLYRGKFICASVCLHLFNWLQVFRLLATRGHYSIDLIIGYVVAVFVSTPAERLGKYYSRGCNLGDVVPQTAVETFEMLVGVADIRNHSQTAIENTMARPTIRVAATSGVDTNGELHDIRSDTSARVAVEIALDLCGCSPGS